MAGFSASRRVVVTGMGAVTSIGHTVADLWAAMREGESGVAPIERFFQNDPHSLTPAQIPNFELGVMIAAQIKGLQQRARLKSFKRDKIIQFADRYSLFAAFAADEAVRQAGLEVPLRSPQRGACIIGTAEGGITNLEIAYRHIFELKQVSSHPLTLVRFIGSSAAAHIGIEFGIKGPVYGICSACASGAHAIGAGRDLIRNGLVDVAIVGGSEAPHTYGTMQMWEATKLLSPDGIFPFAKRRNGTVLGEGAGVLVLESIEHATARGATILAELCGVGATAEAMDLVQSAHEGAAQAMRRALADARLAPGDIGYINAHGLGTVEADRNETRAIRQVFGSHAETLAVSATKAMYGHPLGASGSLGGITCIKATAEGFVPPTLGLDEADPECDLDYVANTGRARTLTYTMANSFALTGLNVALVFGPPPA
jgi:nodulation protein E